jgi:hypothetical protein
MENIENSQGQIYSYDSDRDAYSPVSSQQPSPKARTLYRALIVLLLVVFVGCYLLNR